VVYRFVDGHKLEFGLRWLLKRLSLYPNAYYNYIKNRKFESRKNKQKILEEIKNIYYNHSRIIGHRGMVIFLARKGIVISKTTAFKYMNKDLNLHSIIMKKRPKYIRGEKNKVFPNLLNQKFFVLDKNKVWCTDFTQARLSNGKVRYNCSIIDLHDRSVVASSNSRYINSDLAIETLQKAINSEKPKSNIVLHSDQGSQFASWSFVNFCKSNNITQSMSKVGCPYDNAPMERYFNTFKNELIKRNKFTTEESFDEAVNRYAFVWYNHIRPHTFNSGLTPFEARNK
jgi:hypothetical protein